MRSHPRVKLALLCALASSGGGKATAQNPAEDLPRATIRISAFDPFGAKIKDPRTYLYTLDRKQNLAKNQAYRPSGMYPTALTYSWSPAAVEESARSWYPIHAGFVVEDRRFNADR